MKATVILILSFIFAFIVTIIILATIYRIFEKIEDRKLKELELYKAEFYSRVDSIKLREVVNDWINEYINKYMLANIIIHNIEFVNQDMLKEMIKSVSSQIVVEMSDMYLSFMKLNYNIDNEGALIKFIYNLVTDAAIIKVAEYNKSS